MAGEDASSRTSASAKVDTSVPRVQLIQVLTGSLTQVLRNPILNQTTAAGIVKTERPASWENAFVERVSLVPSVKNGR